MRFNVVLAPQLEGGFTAECVEVPGASAEGKDAEEALRNVAGAIVGVLAARWRQASQGMGLLETVEVDVERPALLAHVAPGRAAVRSTAAGDLRWWR